LKILISITRIIIGIFFILSGIIKLYPIEIFELTFVDLGIGNFQTAPFISRLLIAYEVFIGLCFIFNYKIKTTILQSALLLLFFTIYLLFLIITQGNDTNCGCLGSNIFVSPLQSIIKNIILAGIIYLVYLKGNSFRWKFKWILLIFILVSISTPFILNPVDFTQKQSNENFIPYKINYLNEIPPVIIENDSIFIGEKKSIVAFLSLTCQHCKTVAYKLQIAAKKYNLPPIYFVFKGTYDEKLYQAFSKESNSSLPFTFYNDNNIFKITKGRFPTIMFIENNIVKKVWNSQTLTQEELEKIINLTDN
jgi:thiol-disulfide isomerase/thioredoxin/uncharacterized membrane protein YphA (DoxX/SURF4 family)